MVAIPFPLSSSPGERPQEGAGRLINVFAEPRGENLGPVWKRVAGLRLFCETSREGFRGALVMPGVIYAGFEDVIVAIEEGAESDLGAFLATVHGSLAGTDKLFFARNNNASPQAVAVGDQGAFEITSGGVVSYPDGDVGSPNAVAFLAGYFFFTYGDGKCRTSGINTTAINAADVATAEQHPDGLIRPQPFRGAMLLCGNKLIEAWQNTANPVAFPFSYAHTIPCGLIAPHAMAGGTDEFAQFLLWVADDNTVRKLDGADPTEVSPPDLNRLIEAVADKSTIEACVYVAGGRKFWQVSCPAWTWVLDLATMKWHERDSYLEPRSRITQSFSCAGAFTNVSKWLCGDVSSGNVLEISRDARTEVGNPLRARIESGPVKDFPNRIQVPRTDFDFTPGVGIVPGDEPIETDPVVAISWSDDGGTNWSNPLVRQLGRQGATLARVSVGPTGLSGPAGRRWRLDVSDPVHFGLLGGDMVAAVRAR